tara:strand:- start:750 stop:878 length:129 start_codon:yes stop_codon:yes gene_type:complete
MAKMTEAATKKMIKELKMASRLHAGQAAKLEKTLQKSKTKKK